MPGLLVPCLGWCYEELLKFSEETLEKSLCKADGPTLANSFELIARFACSCDVASLSLFTQL